MSYYEKYLKYKNKYLMLKSQNNFMKGGTMPRLLDNTTPISDSKKKPSDSPLNSTFFEFNIEKINTLVRDINNVENFCEAFLEILTGAHTKKMVLIDASFIFFLFPSASVYLSEKTHEPITYNQLFDNFMIMLQQKCLEQEKQVIFIFENDNVLKGPFGSGNKRKSTLLSLYREFTSLLNYNIYKNDIDHAIEYILEKLNNSYPTMILQLAGEADETTFIKAIEYSQMSSTIITVDGDLVISMLLRNRYSDKKLNDLNIIMLTTSPVNNILSFSNITDNILTDNKSYAKKILTSLIFTSTDAGFGRPIYLPPIIASIESIDTRPAPEVNTENMYNAIVRKFIATLSVLCYGWGVEECVKNMLNVIGCPFTEQLLEIFKRANGQLLVSVDPYFTKSVIYYLFQELLGNNIISINFLERFERELNYLLNFEKCASEYYLLCKSNNIHSSILLLNLYEPSSDFSSKIIDKLYQQPNDFLKMFNSKIIEEFKEDITNAQIVIKKSFTIKETIIDDTVKMIYISKDYLSNVTEKLKENNGKFNIKPFDVIIQQGRLNEIVIEGSYLYPIKMHMNPPQEQDKGQDKGKPQGKSQSKPQGKSQGKPTI
jgi:hypothetical protein